MLRAHNIQIDPGFTSVCFPCDWAPDKQCRRQWRERVAAIPLVIAFATLCSFSSRVQAQSAVHWINHAGKDALTVLNSGSNFVTDFKAVGDVTVKVLASGVNSTYQDQFGGPAPGNNPPYITDFVGDSGTGTGNGIPGNIVLLETRAAAGSIQFDFLSPLTPHDHILIADADFSETYGIQAFVYTSSGYSLASLLHWPYENCSGQTGQVPDSNWAAWNPSTGIITATPSGLNEPLLVLTPDQPVDRIIFSRYAGGSGTAEIQFMAETNSLAWTRLSIRK
jgi:hypothetical protein